MRIDISKYLTERYTSSLGESEYDGPVITIAREFGCPAKKVASRLAKRLTQIMGTSGKNLDWRWISKEILFESAKALEVDPDMIRYVFEYEKKSFFDEILSSQSKKYYKSDRKIRKTIAMVIRNMACEGNVVIIGRGGIAITKDIEKSFHLQLEAPLEWRAMRTSEKYCMTMGEAKKYASAIDKKRQEFRDYYHGKGSDYTSFDARFNSMTLNVDEIVEAVIKMMQIRNLI